MIWAIERGIVANPAVRFGRTVQTSPTTTAPIRATPIFMRKAFAASGDRRYRVLPMPSYGDWLHDFLRFRTLPLRNPLWRMRFPNDKLRAAGLVATLRDGRGETPARWHCCGPSRRTSPSASAAQAQIIPGRSG
jgi:hypothetical protein